MINFENAFSTYLYNKNYLSEVDLNEANFIDLVTNINSLVGECFIMYESMLQSKRNRINNPWITSGIIASIAKKYHLYNLWRKSVKELKNKNGNPLLYSNYKENRKSLKGIINYAKKAHCLKLLKKEEGNSKETWKIINEIRGKHKVKIKPSFNRW